MGWVLVVQIPAVDHCCQVSWIPISSRSTYTYIQCSTRSRLMNVWTLEPRTFTPHPQISFQKKKSHRPTFFTYSHPKQHNVPSNNQLLASNQYLIKPYPKCLSVPTTRLWQDDRDDRDEDPPNITFPIWYKHIWPRQMTFLVLVCPYYAHYRPLLTGSVGTRDKVSPGFIGSLNTVTSYLSMGYTHTEGELG